MDAAILIRDLEPFRIGGSHWVKLDEVLSTFRKVIIA